MSPRKSIPNPATLDHLTEKELAFINAGPESELTKTPPGRKGRTYKGRPISMSDEFFSELNAFLDEFPEEGNRSAMITRVVAEYIRKKRVERL